MFLKKLVPSFLSYKPSFLSDSSNKALISKTKDTSRPTLKQRILEGLPGFATGAVASAAAHTGGAALGATLMSTVSALALAPAAAAASVPAASFVFATAAGAIVNQGFAYVRERNAQLLKENKDKISILSLFNDAAERKAFSKELKTRHFWKAALGRGLISGSLGATTGLLATSGIAQPLIDKTYETIGSCGQQLSGGLRSVISRAASLREIFSFPASSPSERVSFGIVQSPSHEPLKDIFQPPVRPLSLLEKIASALQAGGPLNTTVSAMLEKAEAGNMQSLKDLAVGLNNGVYGIPLDRGLALEAMKIAAEGGNAQAIRDLSVMTGRATEGSLNSAAKSVLKTVSAALPISADTLQTFPVAISDDTRERATAFIRENYPDNETIPTLSAEDLIKSEIERAFPAPVAGETGGCKISMIDRAAKTLCRAFKVAFEPGEFARHESSEGAIRDYVYAGNEPVDSATFLRETSDRFLKHLQAQ